MVGVGLRPRKSLWHSFTYMYKLEQEANCPQAIRGLLMHQPFESPILGWQGGIAAYTIESQFLLDPKDAKGYVE